jgi:TP901 family phage tail tape measure protein
VPSPAAIRAARAFVEFSADLSSLPGDFDNAERQFRAFQNRVNRRNTAGGLRAELDTRALDGQLKGLQSRIQTALAGDPKGITRTLSEVEQRMQTLLPRIQKLYQPPEQQLAGIRDRVAKQVAEEQRQYSEQSVLANRRKVDLERQLADEVQKAKSSGVANPRRTDAIRNELKSIDDGNKAIAARFEERTAAIRDAGYKEAAEYQTKQARVRERLVQDVEDLGRYRGMLQKEQAKLDKGRTSQVAAGAQGANSDAIRAREEEGRAFSEGLRARLSAEAKANQQSIAASTRATKQKYDAIEREQARSLARQQKAEARRVAQIPTTLSVLGQDVRQLGAGITAAGGTLLAGFALSAREFTILDDQLRVIQGVSSASETQILSLEKAVRQLGATTSFTTQEVAGAATELARGGVAIDNIGSILPSVLQLARGTGADLAFAAQSVVRTLGQFRLEADESGRVVDVLSAAANAGTLDLMDLGEAMKFLGPIMKTTGGSVEDAGAAFAVMANNGLRGGLAGRQLRRVLYELADPLKRLRIAQDLGVQVTDAAGNLRPLVDLVEEIGDEINKLSTGAKVSFLDDVFGEGAAAFEALSAGRKEFRGLIGDLIASRGYAEALADNVDGGLGGAFRITLSVIKDFGIEIGKILEGDLVAILQWVQDAVRGAIEWARVNGDLIKTLARMSVEVVAIGTALIGLGATIGVMAAISSGMALLRKQILATGAAAALVGGAKGLLTFAAGLAGMTAVVYAADSALTSFVGGFNQVGEAADTTTSKVGRLKKVFDELAGTKVLDANQISELRSVIASLEKELGYLGAEFDKTGKVANLGDLQKNVDARVLLKGRDERTADFDAEYASIVKDELDSLRRRAVSLADPNFFSAIAAKARRDFEAKTNAARFDDLRARREQFGGEVSSAEGTVRELMASGFDLGKILGGAFGPSLAPLIDKVETTGANLANLAGSIRSAATENLRNQGFGASGFDVAGKNAADAFARLMDGDVKDAFFSATAAVRTGGQGLFGAITGLAAGLELQRRELFNRRAEELVGQFGDRLSSPGFGGGEFGGVNLARQMATNTVSIAEQALREQKVSNDLLRAVRQILKDNPGLLVGGA